MKHVIVLMFLFLSFPVLSQKPYLLSLNEFTIKKPQADFTIAEVIDGRQSKTYVGTVQTGMANKSRPADFSKPLVEEISHLFQKSGFSADATTQVAVRVNYMYIEEVIKATSETGKSNLLCDFFIKEADTYTYVASLSSIKQYKGLDVTAKHAENIAFAIEDVLEKFERKLQTVETENNKVFTRSDLDRHDLVLKDVSQLPILMTSDYQNGIFVNFDEFLKNKPSFTDKYEINPDRKKLKVWTINANGSKEKIEKDIFAVAHENRLYILFDKEYYSLEKEENSFVFTGPFRSDPSAVTTGAILGGAIGGAIAAASTGENRRYRIDLNSGAIIDIGADSDL